jgi:hypothetical protein
MLGDHSRPKRILPASIILRPASVRRVWPDARSENFRSQTSGKLGRLEARSPDRTQIASLRVKKEGAGLAGQEQGDTCPGARAALFSLRLLRVFCHSAWAVNRQSSAKWSFLSTINGLSPHAGEYRLSSRRICLVYSPDSFSADPETTLVTPCSHSNPRLRSEVSRNRPGSSALLAFPPTQANKTHCNCQKFSPFGRG